MLEWRRYVIRRKGTFGLIGFLSSWYVAQLLVLWLFGPATARWWFYWQKPGSGASFSPGILFAPISHDLSTLTHIGSNLTLLLLVGILVEPLIRSKWIPIGVYVIGFLSTLVSNYTALIHTEWIFAGASGGILGLAAFGGLKFVLNDAKRAELRNGKLNILQILHRLGLVLFPPVAFLFEPLINFNPAHTSGIVLGWLAYFTTIAWTRDQSNL